MFRRNGERRCVSKWKCTNLKNVKHSTILKYDFKTIMENGSIYPALDLIFKCLFQSVCVCGGGREYTTEDSCEIVYFFTHPRYLTHYCIRSIIHSHTCLCKPTQNLFRNTEAGVHTACSATVCFTSYMRFDS